MKLVFHFFIKVFFINGNGCFSLKSFIMIFESEFWGFSKVVQMNNGFTIKKNDDKENMVTNIPVSPSSYIIHSPYPIFPPSLSLFSIFSLNPTYFFPLIPSFFRIIPYFKKFIPSHISI